MDVMRQILEILRDLGIVIGIPTLITLWLQMIRGRIEALEAQIAFLKQTQYPNALAVIQAQKSLHEMELRQLRQELRKVSSIDNKEKKAIEEDIQTIEQSLASLEKLKQDIAGGIESEAVRKFELFCKGLKDPNNPTADYIFMSVTYGDGIGFVETNALEQKGLIEIRDGNVYLTKKGKEIWVALRHLER